MLTITTCGAPPTPTPSPTSQATPSSKPQKTYQDLEVGFAAIACIDDWHGYTEHSLKETADQFGVSLDYRDSQSSQDNQIRAIKDFTAGEVDVIGVMPVVTDGYDGVFQAAKEAGIPIIVVDRRADVPEDLYTTYLASDFVEEGRQAARVLAELTGGQANIVELAGIEGDYVAIERGQGFRDVLPEYPGMKILASEDRGFNIPESKPVMAGLLQQYGDQIDALYAHNDQMARGAIEAIEEYGLRPGVDIKIVSIGGRVEGRTLEEIAAFCAKIGETTPHSKLV
jgi:simple sugar transport system substrate-binding protein